MIFNALSQPREKMDIKFFEAIEQARHIPLLPNALTQFKEPMPGLSIAALSDLVDMVLAYGFPTFFYKPMVRLPISERPIRSLCVGLEGDSLGIFVGNIGGLKHEAFFANAAMFWEWSWSVQEVLDEMKVIDAKMRLLGFYDTYEGRRLNLFEANLPIPVDHVFPGPHAFYELTFEADAEEIAACFDRPDKVVLLTHEDRRIICHEDHAAAVATVFQIKKPQQRTEHRSDPLTCN